MRSDERSRSFTFHRPEMNLKSQNEIRITRQRLQDRFDNECPYSFKSTKEVKTSESRWANLNLSSVSLPPIHPRRVLRCGADKLSQTFNNVRTTFGTLSQKFRTSTRRRYRLKNDSPNSPVTPQSRSRHLLGRTPTKLYSPFGIESPFPRPGKSVAAKDKENGMGSGRYTPKRRSLRSNCYNTASGSGINYRNTVHDGKKHFYSPQQKFSCDLEEARIGIWELDQTANNIENRDNTAKTGNAGWKKCIYDAANNIVLDITGKESPVLSGIMAPESSGTNAVSILLNPADNKMENIGLSKDPYQDHPHGDTSIDEPTCSFPRSTQAQV